MILATLTIPSILLNLLFLALGVFLLVKGADIFVSSASSIAKKFKMSALVIGMTVVAFGTSAPELAVSLSASLKGNSGISLGNVVGSNFANIAMVLGLSAILNPINIKKSITKRELPFLIGATVLLMIFAFDNLFAGYNGTPNILSRGESLIFLIGIVSFVLISIKMAKKDAELDPSILEGEDVKEMGLTKSIVLFIVGLALIIIGAEFVTTPASTLAIGIGVALKLEESLVINVVGLTVVAVGTSLPELMTSVIAAKKGENEIAVGNVVGSNIFNILFICGASGIINPLTMSADIMTDMVLTLFLTIFVLVLAKKGSLTRKNGFGLLSIYFVYLAYIIIRLFYPFICIPA